MSVNHNSAKGNVLEERRAAYGRVAVLMGGCSSEREISLRSGTAVSEALRSKGCSVDALDIRRDEEQDIVNLLTELKPDVAFIALHGRLGEDGKIQGILESLKIPYVGSAAQASFLALHKGRSYEIFSREGIPAPQTVILKKGEAFDPGKILTELKGWPVVVKPACEGSSIGVSAAANLTQWQDAILQAFVYDEEILLQQHIKGRELTVGILAESALPVIEVKPQEHFFDFASKYESQKTQYLIPAPLPPALALSLQDLALKAHQALGCLDLSRVDILLDEEDHPYVLEVNTIPGFTATSLLPKAARLAGLEFADLCLKLLDLAYEKKFIKEAGSR